ncbi:MAG: cation-transporting P-type ATPase [Meiothermus sp.]|nr:cation-transporting P-type ATPase [Meiothermus sp.]
MTISKPSTSASGAPNSLEALSAREVYAALNTGPDGLEPLEAAARLGRYGRNVLSEARGRPLLVRFLGNFTHLMALLLWAGGLVAFAARMPQLGVAVWLVNLINGAFSFWQEFKAERATEALKKLLPSYARVLRGGQEQRVAADELVPGDVMLLSEGDHISADGRLLESAELQVDQSTLTGESRPVRRSAEAVKPNGLSRSELPNLVFAGTSVVAGSGRAVVVATAMETEFGRIARLTQTLGDELSPLQKEIAVLTRAVTLIAVAVGVLFFGLAVWMAHMPPAEGFIFGLGMIVAFVPEGLLPTVTLALALGVQRMAGRHALIKRLSAVETLGCTSVICTDKTGTLTQNEMTVREIWAGGVQFSVGGVGYGPEGEIAEAVGAFAGKRHIASLQDAVLRECLTAAALCNNARLLPPGGDSSRWSVLGDTTEAALLVAARKGGVDLEAAYARSPRLRELPFDPRRKRMSTVHQVGGGRTAYIKGAPKEVLGLCSRLRLEGHDRPISDQLREEVVAANDQYARAGLRVLAIARRDLPQKYSGFTPEELEQDLTFLGLMAMFDPPRPQVSTAVEQCHRAGIRIVMITGDYGLTAESIARRIGIVRGERPRIVTGLELAQMSEVELRAALGEEVIFARVAPEDKLRVVAALQDAGHVVAVTGDGVNDAPALKKADIGVAMGITGTDVAKEAADMILTDDNFASMVGAVEEGRTVYANIKKFTTYIFTSNTPEAVPFIVYAFSGGQIPLALNVMQILAVDLGTDLVPALALGAEPPEPGVMERPPRKLSEHVVTPGLLARAYLWLGPIQSLAAMSAFFYLFWTSGYWGQFVGLPGSGPLYQAATAMALGAVVFTQVGNLFAQRTERGSVFRIGMRTNRLIWAGIATEMLVLVLIVYVPFFQNVFGTATFGLQGWLFLLAWMPALLVADELRKWVVRRRAGGWLGRGSGKT